ncbi:YqaJ viral recombinase family nuclease [Fodinibius sp. AD559]|uniref:YqaJ viral recombinase family nuclease n=1 Tax=Fodinibius sp. AD559 TaxID=3424179 RepID=UPI004046AC4D
MATNYNLEIPTEEWVEDRQNYIGGSETAALCQKSSFKTPLQVWMRKQGLIDPVESTPIMEFGNVFEPVQSGYFEDLTGLKTRRVNTPFVHKEHGFLRANIDRQILNGEGVQGTGVLELKTTNSYRLKSLGGRYPIEWEYQIQHYLGLTGYQYAYLFIYERDTCEFYEPILIERDDELIEETMAKLIKWWHVHMIGGKRPEPQNEEDLLMLYPDSSDGKVVEASPSARQSYQELKQVREEKSELKDRESELKNKLKQQLGDGERLVYGGQTLVTWKSYERQRLDSTKLREEKPEVYSNYQTESSYRRFSVK